MKSTPSVNSAAYSGEVVSRAEARKLAKSIGQRQEPYRGYGFPLPGNRFLYCAPDGKFYVRLSV